jgi:hypothetical protein
MVPPAPAAAAPTGNPAFTDPAATDDDFPFQGEYAGLVRHEAGETKFGVQVVALGAGKFAAVAYPGGLPGEGWTPPDTISGSGVREGEKVKLEGVDLGGGESGLNALNALVMMTRLAAVQAEALAREIAALAARIDPAEARVADCHALIEEEAVELDGHRQREGQPHAHAHRVVHHRFAQIQAELGELLDEGYLRLPVDAVDAATVLRRFDNVKQSI